jgi:hypothetical protein
MYNYSTGEIVSVYQQNGKLPGFETVQECEEVIKNDLHKLQTPAGYGVYAKCIEPSAVTT